MSKQYLLKTFNLLTTSMYQISSVKKKRKVFQIKKNLNNETSYLQYTFFTATLRYNNASFMRLSLKISNRFISLMQ